MRTLTCCRCNIRILHIPSRAHPSTASISDRTTIATQRDPGDLSRKPSSYACDLYITIINVDDNTAERTITYALSPNTYHQPFRALLPRILGHDRRHDPLCRSVIFDVRYTSTTPPHLFPESEQTQDLVRPHVRSNSGRGQSDGFVPLRGRQTEDASRGCKSGTGQGDRGGRWDHVETGGEDDLARGQGQGRAWVLRRVEYWVYQGDTPDSVSGGGST
jgi:hypothetical protein